MKRILFVSVLAACVSCSTSIGTSGVQFGFGSGSQDCDSPMTCSVDCQRQGEDGSD